MNRATKRIDDVEAALTPQQLTVRWMVEVHRRFPSFGDYVGWLVTVPHSSLPLHCLPQQAERSIYASMKKQSPEAVRHAVRRAVRDITFLVVLHGECNAAAMRQIQSH